jgi:hypothetical protein
MPKVAFDIQSRSEKITSLEMFVREVFELRKQHHNRKFWYRGIQKVRQTLTPTVGRELKYAGKKLRLDHKAEINLLHRFRRRAYPLVGRSMTAGEAIFLARHHGLPTRLLDWTANALYALYFACVEDECKGSKPEHGKVWAMLPRERVEPLDAFDLAKKETEKQLFNLLGRRSVKIVHPFYNSPRIVAQDGAFTIQSEPRVPIEDYKGQKFDEQKLDIEMLYYWEIHDAEKPGVLADLSGLGITHRMIYPDLDGIAKSLWETEVLWQRRNAVS